MTPSPTRGELLRQVADKFPNTPEGADAALEHAKKVADFVESGALEMRLKIDTFITQVFAGAAASNLQREELRKAMLEFFL
jgi:hypothetical protein